MQGVQKGYHCAWEIHYHPVMPVKYRKALVSPAIEQTLVRVSGEIAERYAIEPECLGTDQDHVHLLCSAHPKLTPGRIVQIWKSLTARAIFKQHPEIKKELWGGEFWTDGYYAATVSEQGSSATVEKYITNQGQPKEDLRQLKLF